MSNTMIGGLLAPQPARPQPSEGFAGFLNNPAVSDTLQALGYSLMSSPGGAPLANMGQYLPAILEKREATNKRNKTLDYLRQSHPDIASMVEGGLDVGDAFTISQRREAAAREDERAKRNDAFRNGEFEYRKSQDAIENEIARGKLSAAGGAEYGLQPVYGTDADGRTVIGQLGKDGTIVQSRRPEGFTPMSPYELQFGKSRGGAEGKARGEENAGAPAAIAAASDIGTKVEALKNDPGLDSILGPIDSRTPNFFAGATDAQAKLDQLKGEAFMQARQLLKGGGQITDFEGRKAEQAMARLSQAQSKEDFVAALDDFNDAVQRGAQRLAERSGNTMPPANSGDGGNSGAGATTGGLKWKVK